MRKQKEVKYKEIEKRDRKFRNSNNNRLCLVRGVILVNLGFIMVLTTGFNLEIRSVFERIMGLLSIIIGSWDLWCYNGN